MFDDALNQMSRPHRMQVRRAFQRLGPDEQREVARIWQRHRRACDRHGCDPDPATLREAIADIKGEMI